MYVFGGTVARPRCGFFLDRFWVLEHRKVCLDCTGVYGLHMHRFPEKLTFRRLLGALWESCWHLECSPHPELCALWANFGSSGDSGKERVFPEADQEPPRGSRTIKQGEGRGPHGRFRQVQGGGSKLCSWHRPLIWVASEAGTFMSYAELLCRMQNFYMQTTRPC